MSEEQMGFYLRKSVSVGPFRFNLSGSGVGVSVGVRGFRVGSGPRGNYVRIGRSGVYYRQAVPSAVPPRALPPVAAPLAPGGITHAEFQEIDSADVANITDSSSAQLLAEIREKNSRIRLLPLAIVAAVIAMMTAADSGFADWAVGAAILFSTAAIVAAQYRDTMAKTVVILYELDSTAEAAFKRFVEWAEAVAASARVWHVAASADVYDRKYHAGANQLVSRTPTALVPRAPSFVRTNVPVFSLAAGRQTLFFFPDRLLVHDGANVGGVAYGSLLVDVKQTRFIEDGGAPHDARVVDTTWRYVNRSGGPDRRFNNNVQLPVCLYDELTLRTVSGLNEVVQISRCGVAEGFVAAIRHMAGAVPG